MPTFTQFNPTRLRSYVLRLPLCTRLLVVAILGLWIASIPFPWIREFGRLEPAKMDLTQSMSIFLVAEAGSCVDRLFGFVFYAQTKSSGLIWSGWLGAPEAWMTARPLVTPQELGMGLEVYTLQNDIKS